MKSMFTRFTFVSGAFVLCSLLNQSFADITFIFSPTPSGGVSVTGSGSGLVNRPSGIASSDWDVQDFMTDFLKDTFTDVAVSAETVSGAFTNVTTGVSEPLLNFDVDRDPSSGDDLDYDTANVLSFAFEDEFLFELTATFEPASLAFSDLVQGTHIDVGRTQGAGLAEESFGITTVMVVPEPNILCLLIASLATAQLLGSRGRHG